ncbi:MAG: hypothetical protein WCS03_14270 [Bacteroidota bacterium]
MRYVFFVSCIIVLSAGLKGQSLTENLNGKVSFISSQNVYVKFTSTAGISAGDTLYKMSEGKHIPVLKVINSSSTSCVCTTISSAIFSVADQIIAIKRNENFKPKEKATEKVAKASVVKKDADVFEKKQPSADGLKQKINGSLSAFSYSNFSNTPAINSTRFRYNFSLDARNIGNSKFSIESYVSFNHKLGEWSVVKSNVFNALKIYNLSVKYDLNKSTHISLGRKINQRIASIGAMDGLQVEKSINKFTIGALVGSRPDFENYGFDIKLFQYGAYLALNTTSGNNYSESSIAIMQQTNNRKTDRRFLYFQHSNSLIKNIYFFSTFEVDLFKLKSDTLNSNLPQNIFNLTGLYLSLRYKMTKNLTITGSYDSRKNVIYYETFKTFIDRILESEMRQSFRLQSDYRITSKLTFGLQSGYRFLKSDPHPSKNVYGYLNYYQIPGINISVNLSGTYLVSNYLNSKILGVSISRDFFKGKFYTGIGYRYVDYSYNESLLKTIQNIGEMNVTWQFAGKMSLSLNYEGTFEKPDIYNRFYLQIRKRF